MEGYENRSYGDKIVGYLGFAFRAIAHGIATLPETNYFDDIPRRERVYHRNSDDVSLESKGLWKRISR